MKNQRPMSAEEFRRLRRRLKVTQRALGERLGRSTVSVSRYECALAPIPLVVAEALRGLAAQAAA